jgi:hypothetical protein
VLVVQLAAERLGWNRRRFDDGRKGRQRDRQWWRVTIQWWLPSGLLGRLGREHGEWWCRRKGWRLGRCGRSNAT